MGLLDKLLQSEEPESSECDVTNSEEYTKQWFPSCFIYTRFGASNKISQLVKPRGSYHWQAITVSVISGSGEIGERCVLTENLSNNMLVDIKPKCYQPYPEDDPYWVYYEDSAGIQYVNERKADRIDICPSEHDHLLSVAKSSPGGDWVTAPDWLLEHLIKDM